MNAFGYRNWQSVIRGNRFTLLTLCTVLASPNLALANWQTTPSIAVGGHYDDNVRLDAGFSGADESAEGYAVDAELEFRYLTQITEFSIMPRILVERYSSSSELDTTDEFLDFDLRRQGEKSRFRLRGNYSQESVRRAERLETDFDIEELIEISEDDSGIVLSDEDRQRISVMPEFAHRFTQKSLGGLRLQYVDVSYDAGTGAGLRDFTNSGINVFYEYGLTQRNALLLNAQGHRYDPNTGADSTGYGLGVGLRRALSDRTTFEINAGIDSTEDDAGNDQENAVGDISVTHRLQTSRFLAAYRRNVAGTGFGDISVRDTLILNFTRELSERSRIGFGIRAYSRESLGGDDQSFVERDYLQFRARYEWNLTRTLYLDLDYRYTDLERSDEPGSENSNRINVWLRYRPVRQR